jgi:TRAP-type C4-dicarboxylate transport system permease small subunit
MVINVLWQVFSRYFTDNPSSFTDELARYLMMWLGILGAAYVGGRNEHVAIDFFCQKKLVLKYKSG